MIENGHRSEDSKQSNELPNMHCCTLKSVCHVLKRVRDWRPQLQLIDWLIDDWMGFYVSVQEFESKFEDSKSKLRKW